uniref:Glycosyltransferase family 92 protein n=1 Tax=Strongyloides papillosus TaxID=174720 RepID=A0A0N5C5W2_STREA
MILSDELAYDDSNSCSIVTINESTELTEKKFLKSISIKLYILIIIGIISALVISSLIGVSIYFYYKYHLIFEYIRIGYGLSTNNVSFLSEVENKSIPVLWKHPLVSHINCGALLNGDSSYIMKESKELKKLKYLPNTFSTLCEDIKKRGHYPDKPLSQEEADFPIAYIRTIYKDYLTLEYQFLLTYAPQNYYCFIIDKKQPADFHNKMSALAGCFKNVHIIQNRYQMDSNGININNAYYDCMKYLNDKNYKYVVVLNVSFLNIILFFFQLLQNDDMPLKTNREIVEILKIYNGSIDIEYADPRPFYNDRVNLSLDWSLGHLEIFKEGDPRKLDNKILSSQLEIQKGYNAIFYPKETVKYFVEELNLTKFFKQLDDMNLYANDEFGFQSLIANEYLNIPGRIDADCLKKDYFFKDSYMTRYVKWIFDGDCDESETRHYVCLQNIKTLHSIKKVPHLFVNKFKGEFDFGGLTCWVEYMYDRTYFKHYKPINKSFYENLSLVKYGNLKNHIKDKEQLCEMSRSNN